jgi:hypothetical protein
VINLVLTGPTEHHRDADGPVLHAAVLGWYEGHIEGEDSSGHAPQMPTTFPSDEMPSPPFPAPGSDSPVRKVAAEVNDRCDPADLNGRVALAAALAGSAAGQKGAAVRVARRAGVRTLKGPPACVRANTSLSPVFARDGGAVVAAGARRASRQRGSCGAQHAYRCPTAM